MYCFMFHFDLIVPDLTDGKARQISGFRSYSDLTDSGWGPGGRWFESSLPDYYQGPANRANRSDGVAAEYGAGATKEWAPCARSTVGGAAYADARIPEPPAWPAGRTIDLVTELLAAPVA